jgi:hypothetical protein
VKRKSPILAAVLVLYCAVLAFAQTHTFAALDLSNTFTAANTFTQQLVSSVSTGTAPFSIASTSVVANLNSQLHNGLTAPGSAIVGVSDTQTLTNKTLTSPTINSPTINSVAFAGAPEQIVNVNLTLVSASASTTSNQNLQSFTYSSGVLNTVGKTFRVTSEGSISFVNTTETVVLGTNIGGVPQEAFSFVPPTTGGGNWILNMDCTVGATGASGNVQCSATLDLSIGATSNVVSTRMMNQNNPLSVNLTGTVVVQHFVSFTTASTSNVANQLRMVSEQRN